MLVYNYDNAAYYNRFFHTERPQHRKTVMKIS